MHSHAGAIVGPEPLRPEFSESLFAMLDRVFRAGSERSMRTDYPFFFREENFANLFICRLGGRVLTHLGLLPVTLSYFGHPIRVGMIGGVATDPDFREQGLATRTLREVLSHCRRIGGELVMISGGRGLYLRHGARSVGKFDQYVLELNYAAQPGVRLERCGPRHASIMSTLHRQKPFRFVRPLEEWRLNVGAGRCQGRPSDYWLVRRGEEASAYFAFPDRAQDARGVCELREWGGQVEDIIAALPQVGRAAGCKGVLWRLYPHETRARRAIEAAGARGAGPTAVQGTARVVNADALMASLAGYHPRWREIPHPIRHAGDDGAWARRPDQATVRRRARSAARKSGPRAPEGRAPGAASAADRAVRHDVCMRHEVTAKSRAGPGAAASVRHGRRKHAGGLPEGRALRPVQRGKTHDRRQSDLSLRDHLQ